MAKQEKPEAATSPGFETKTTVGSSDKAAANTRRDDIRSGREDIQGPHYAGDNNSILERYQRTLAKLDGVIGKAQAEKRKTLSALTALKSKVAMGSNADKQDDGGSLTIKEEVLAGPTPEAERKHPKPEQGNAYKLPEQKPQPLDKESDVKAEQPKSDGHKP